MDVLIHGRTFLSAPQLAAPTIQMTSLDDLNSAKRATWAKRAFTDLVNNVKGRAFSFSDKAFHLMNILEKCTHDHEPWFQYHAHHLGLDQG